MNLYRFSWFPRHRIIINIICDVCLLCEVVWVLMVAFSACVVSSMDDADSRGLTASSMVLLLVHCGIQGVKRQ